MFTGAEKSTDMPGLEKILKGILTYQANLRPAMVSQFEKIKNNPEPTAVMFSCMDSRVILTRMLGSNVGDYFLVRNAGNLVPHNDTVTFDAVTTEPGALELGCVINDIRNVIVCGHADCKAMNLLYTIKDQMHDHVSSAGSPLQLWLKKHGQLTVDKYNKWKAAGEGTPIVFQGETPDKEFEAYIDPDNKFAEVDKFSQINTLQQVQNIASHPVIYTKLVSDYVRLNALWLDIYKGDFYMFSRERKCFVEVNQESYDHLLKDGLNH